MCLYFFLNMDQEPLPLPFPIPKTSKNIHLYDRMKSLDISVFKKIKLLLKPIHRFDSMSCKG